MKNGSSAAASYRRSSGTGQAATGSDGIWRLCQRTGGEIPQLQQAEENADRAEALAQQLKADDLQQRAAQVEQVIAEQSAEDGDNLGIWNRVYKTDAKFTKAFSNNGGGTSINGTYMVMQATKVFGPQGINWGVEIIEERFDNGAPILRPVRQQDGAPFKRSSQTVPAVICAK